MTESTVPATVLIVEDNPANLLLAEEILKLGGYGTIGAASADKSRRIKSGNCCTIAASACCVCQALTV